VRNSGHYGAAGAYAAMASRAGLMGMALTNVKTPALVPTHGSEACLGTNPIAFSAPADNNRPFLLDMATSIVPVGKVVMAKRRGRLIPRGWAQDSTGKTLRNPDKAIAQRRLAPLGSTPEMGDHKGYGLAAMVEILSSVLPGNQETDGVGHFFLVMDPGRFGEPGAFTSGVDDMMDGLRSSTPQNPDQPVQVAGDPEYSAAERHQREGIPMTRSVLEDIRMVCRESGATFYLDPKPKPKH
jgi:LDH2 family malate/lactate/ureidoglycolate dehydrogenase